MLFYIKVKHLLKSNGNLRLRQTNWFVGLHAKEFRIQLECVEMTRCKRWCSPFFNWQDLFVILCNFISWQQEIFVACAKFCPQQMISLYFAFGRRNEKFLHLCKNSCITKHFTENNQFAESIENMFSKIKVEGKKSICGFACNRIQNYAWVEMLPCVRWSNLFQNLFPMLVIFSILNNWTISWRVKKRPQTKDLFLIYFSKGKIEYFLRASKYEEWIWRFLVKSIWASNCLQLK